MNGKNVLIALGGNATSRHGGPRETVVAALDVLRGVWGEIEASRLFQTPSFPAGSGPDFINAACAFSSSLSPAAILARLHQIEADFGRERSLRWGQRTLDLDLIAVGPTVLPDISTQTHWRTLAFEDQKIRTPDTLILPHPRVQDRPFVLVPLADVAPDWTHPLLGQSVTQMLATYSDAARAEIKALP